MVLYKPKISISSPDSQEGFFPNWVTEKRVKNVLSFLGLAILLIIFGQFSKQTVFPGKMALLPIFATAFIIFAGPHSWLNRKILSHKVLVWFGLISYPLYLWHWPILSFGRIIYGEMPPREFRLIAVAVSILLAWLTVKIIEKQFRFGNQKIGLKIAILCLVVFGIGGAGLFVMNTDGYLSREEVMIRKNVEDIIGMSDRWYRGKNDWLFLGNAFDKTVSKLKLSITPNESDIEYTEKLFKDLAKTCSKSKTKLVLIIGPNKNNIYSEYLPESVIPSQKKYSSFFLEPLKKVPGLTFYDPTNDLLSLKEKEGILYWKTDTHWNYKGAFLVYSGFSKLLNLPIPEVEFQHNGTHPGDLYKFSGIKDFPLTPNDNWEVIWKNKPELTEKEIPDGQINEAAGKPVIVSNSKPLLNKKIWVTGDSFTNAQKQYFNATFKEVRYIGHWAHTLKELASKIEAAKDKPDMIVIVRVERSF